MKNNSNIFQQKLARHELPIDDSFWAEMETRLNNKQRKRVVPLWAWLGGIAASLALLVGINLFFNSNENILPVADGRDAINRVSTTETIIAENKQEKNNIIITTVTISSECGLTGTLIEIVNPAPADTIIPEKTEIAENQKTEKKKPTTKLTTKLKPNTAKSNFKPQTSNFKQTSIAIAANYGGTSGGGRQTDLASADNSAMYGGLSKAPAYALTNTAEQITLEQILQNYPEENHLPPLSFSISLRKNFGRYFALETGLTYTYLHSEFRRDYTWCEHDRATLTQHYLGVPLAAVVNIVNDKTWNVYFSLGGMVEKGLWLDYNRDQTSSYSTVVYNQNLQEKIGGFQWSAAAAMGVSYRFLGNFALYVEPKLNYYFDSDQPRSFRTQSPLNLGLNAGVRVEF
jgi:hypothetical protein